MSTFKTHYFWGSLRFAAWRWAGLLPQKLVRRTELSATTKLSSGDETPPIANVLLAVRALFCNSKSFIFKVNGYCLVKEKCVSNNSVTF